jgi:cytochrome c-type biogenesis protein CcmH/NrfG
MPRIPTFLLNGSAIGLLGSTLAVMAQAPESLQRARNLLAHGQVDEAGHTLEGFLQRHPGNADAWTLLGAVRVQQNEPAKAEGSFHKHSPSNRTSRQQRPISATCCWTSIARRRRSRT